MGEIKRKLTENRVRDDLDENATLTSMCCNPCFSLRVVGSYSDGGMIAGGSKYPHNGVNTASISIRQALDLLEMEDKHDWVDENWYELKDGFNGFKHFSPDVNVFVDVLVDIEYGIKMYSGERVSFVERVNLNSDCSTKLADCGVGSEIKVSEFTKDSITIETTQKTYDIGSVRNSESELNDLLGEYISDESVWVEAQFGEFTELEDELMIPLYSNDSTYKIRFKEPFTDDNPVWSLASEFNFEDPWNLEREPCKYSIHSAGRKGFRDGFIRVSTPKVKSKSGLLSSVFEYFHDLYL